MNKEIKSLGTDINLQGETAAAEMIWTKAEPMDDKLTDENQLLMKQFSSGCQ